ncbi:MAG: TetR/AcrR family transcriptional regulator [Pseudomonadota bacterium]|nr:TetR/AcrR family transcriptional regulator [Pseudomonadota bacterium]
MARPLAFDPQEKLHQAMLLFWRQGYESTSVQDLVDTLQINRFSLYNTFGDKEALYERVIRHYRAHVFSHLEAHLQPASEGLPRLFAYLDAVCEGLARQPEPCGCLLQNSVISRNAFSPPLQGLVDEFITTLQGHVLAIMEAAVALGQVNTELSPAALADFVVIQIQGMLVASKGGAQEALQNSVAALASVLGYAKLGLSN